MKIGPIKLEQVYFFVNWAGTQNEAFDSEEAAIARVNELKRQNCKLHFGHFYGDFKLEGKTLSYSSFGIIPVSEDVDASFISSKNMTELKRKFQKELRSFSSPRLATFTDGEIKTVSKKTSTKPVLFVEEEPFALGEQDPIVGSILEDTTTNNYIQGYNLLPDAKHIYRKEYVATDYSSAQVIYTIKAYRVLERAATLEELDKKVTNIQNSYIACRKYGVSDESRLKVMRVPSLKTYPVFYHEDAVYLSPTEIIDRYDARTTDLQLLRTLISDSYTNLKPSIYDEDSMELLDDIMNEPAGKETRRSKVLRLKRSLNSEIVIYENLLAQEDKSFEHIREIEHQKLRIGDVLHGLIYNLVYRNSKTKQVNYSILRHLASILKQRDDLLNELRDDYMDNLVKYYMETIERSHFDTDIKFHLS